MKEMKEFYQFLEGVEGHEDALAFIKEHNGKIADLEAKVRLSGKDTEELTEKIKLLGEEKKSLQELVDASKGNESVAMKEMQQNLKALQERFEAKEAEAVRLAEEKVLIEGRNTVNDLLSKNGVNTSSEAYHDFLNSRYGKTLKLEEGKLIYNNGKDDLIGDAAIEHIKTSRSDLVATKEGTSSKQTTGGRPTVDKFAGLSSMQKLTYGMGE